jgi:hypothetical protein
MPLARAWRNVVGTLLLALPLPTVSAGLELGRVIHVVDGDTLDVLMADKRTLGTARQARHGQACHAYARQGVGFSRGGRGMGQETITFLGGTAIVLGCIVG